MMMMIMIMLHHTHMTLIFHFSPWRPSEQFYSHDEYSW